VQIAGAAPVSGTIMAVHVVVAIHTSLPVDKVGRRRQHADWGQRATAFTHEAADKLEYAPDNVRT